MRIIVMDVGISGGRADGTDWPPVGGELTCSDAEAAELVAATLAHYPESSGAAEAASPPAEAVPEPAVKPPSVRASRADWAAHAVARGADPDEVDDMTKSALIAAYGNGA